ncbi:hypothetical protein AGDE_14182 [Angomonas deanei]|uniref:Uncharacterized protein n=1 Tax=Angomonas deanei TaxID=59799 RepID=A0A7G2CI31_9TRYP|nr:hypothetical protein AGDE_14182 [Angomonas deanei]CAD2219520.1 hypothetical protein, conserved [Angomonas deanei]|eukprot:EPY21271.1 hypothetical protein AGDE_14182 [Angomonas deanei]
MVSCLLHLLEDKRATVISRAVSTIDTLLTDAAFQPLLDTTQGTTLRGFAQHKLLGLCKSGGKLTTDITKHFLHRWLAVVAQDDGVTAVSHPLMVSELFSLAILGAGEFPYEVNDSHALVHLLKAMLAQCSIKSKNGVDEAQLRSVMRGVAKSLWRNAQHPRSAQEAVGSMVALRILTLVSPCWVEPLEEALLQALDPQTTSGKSEEESGGVLLQATHIMGALLPSSVPVLSLDHISKALSSLLSNYVGPLQQRISSPRVGH